MGAKVRRLEKPNQLALWKQFKKYVTGTANLSQGTAAEYCRVLIR